MAIENNKILYRASDSLNCPSHDSDDAINFMSLLGSDSPLPHYLLSMIHSASDDAKQLKLLLQSINQRIYELFFECGKPIEFEKPQSRTQLTKMQLQELIQQQCPNNHILSIDKTISWITINNPALLGKTILGNNTILGRRILTDNHAIKITLAPNNTLPQSWRLGIYQPWASNLYSL